MIPRTFAWFFSFSSSSYIVPVVLYNTEKVKSSNTHVENQNTKRRMEPKNIPYFWFWINDVGGLILWRRLVLWVKIPLTLASHILVVIFVVE